MDQTLTAEAGKPLSQRLREVSYGGHGGGDRGDDGADAPEPRFATAYLRGGLNREGIAAQAAQHYLMYEVIERAAAGHREREGEAFAFWLPELHRLPNLVEDLEYWIGSGWEAEVHGRYATEGIMRYRARLEEVMHDSFPLFVAHHYTRYLADLSGGQMIARMFRASYDVVDDAGVRFYVFDEISDPTAYKAGYRELLDAAGFTPQQQTDIAEEVALAYRLNNLAGEDLEARFEEYAA